MERGGSGGVSSEWEVFPVVGEATAPWLQNQTAARGAREPSEWAGEATSYPLPKGTWELLEGYLSQR